MLWFALFVKVNIKVENIYLSSSTARQRRGSKCVSSAGASAGLQPLKLESQMLNNFRESNVYVLSISKRRARRDSL